MENNGNGKKKLASRKFMVVVIVSWLITLTIIVATITNIYGMPMNWVMPFLSVLGSVYPVYLGANALSKNKDKNS